MAKLTQHDAASHPYLAIDLEAVDERESCGASIRRFFSNLKNLLPMFGVLVKFAFTNAKAHKGRYCISFSSVFLVVFLCVVLLATMHNLPIIFLRLGDEQRGQNDLVISPGGELDFAASLNYSIVEHMFPETDFLRGYHAPRITWMTSVFKYEMCGEIESTHKLWFGKNGEKCEKGCMDVHCGNVSIRQRIMAIDVEREARMGFGSSMRDLKIGKGEVVLSVGAARAVNDSKIGDTILLYADVAAPLLEAFSDIQVRNKGIHTIMEMRVVDVVEPDRSKFSMDDFILVNYKTVLEDVARGLNPGLNASLREKVLNMDPKVCASVIFFNLGPEKRREIYESGDYETIRRSLSFWAASIVEPLGFNQVSVKANILEFLYSVRYFSLFMKLIVSLILFSSAFLSVLLLYSLLNLTLETRSYELGILRMLGFSKGHLVLMLLVNAYTFAVPAWIAGLIFGYASYLVLRVVFGNILGIQLPYFISFSIYGWATFVGLVLPLISFILPVRALVAQKLSDALTSTRGRNSGVVYKIVNKRDSRSLNSLMVSLGLALVVFGAVIYYFLPFALLRMRLDLLFYIFFALLIGMLMGLVILALNFDRVFQKVALHLFLCFETGGVFQMVQKFLIAHRVQNRKITLMYAFSLGFIIFLAITFQVQLNSIRYGVRREMGAEVVIFSSSMDFATLSELAAHVRDFLPEVAGLTYLARPAGVLPIVRRFTLMSPGRYREAAVNALSGIPPNYFDVLNDEFLAVDSYDERSRKYSIAGALYTRENNKMILSASAYSFLKLDSLDEEVILSTHSANSFLNRFAGNLRFAVKPSAVLSASPQVDMSKYGGERVDALVSLPAVVRYTGIDYLGVRSMRLEMVSLRVRNKDHVEKVTREVKKYLRHNKVEDVHVRDSLTSLGHLRIADHGIGVFLIFTQILTLAVCFFLLLGGMTANVTNSTKEIGVARCIGMTKPQIFRIFAWEAFVILISAEVLGIFIGVVVGYTMYLQNALLTQHSVQFSFPYLQVVIAFVMAILATLLSSCGPVAFLMRLSITHILRQVY